MTKPMLIANLETVAVLLRGPSSEPLRESPAPCSSARTRRSFLKARPRERSRPRSSTWRSRSAGMPRSATWDTSSAWTQTSCSIAFGSLRSSLLRASLWGLGEARRGAQRPFDGSLLVRSRPL